MCVGIFAENIKITRVETERHN